MNILNYNYYKNIKLYKILNKNIGNTIVYFATREKKVYFASVTFDALANKRGQQLHE